MPAPGVIRGTIVPDRRLSDPDFLSAYEWVEERLGFFPLFLAVGKLEEIAWMTGYQDNWRVVTGGETGESGYRKICRKKGEFPNLALLSFESVEGVFMDYDYWHIALNACMNDSRVSRQEESWIFKPSWTKSRWLHAVLAGTHPVQLVTSALPLTDAREIRVRNQVTRRLIKSRGFGDVRVLRIPVNPCR
ncbi:MAG: hypothetical protein WC342_05255 [Methanoregula sp.]